MGRCQCGSIDSYRVVSIEAAIRQYVQKYAKTAKIRNIVDTFMHKLEEVGCFEETKKNLRRIEMKVNVLLHILKILERMLMM